MSCLYNLWILFFLNEKKTYALFCGFSCDTKGALFWHSQHAGKFFMLAKGTWTSGALSTSDLPCKGWGVQREPAHSLGPVSVRASGSQQPRGQSVSWGGRGASQHRLPTEVNAAAC